MSYNNSTDIRSESGNNKWNVHMSVKIPKKWGEKKEGVGNLKNYECFLIQLAICSKVADKTVT